MIHPEVEGDGFPLFLNTGRRRPELVANALWPLFPRIGAPTLIIAGEQEAEDIDSAVASLLNGESVILPGLGRVDGWLRSDLVVPHARRFLAEALA